MCFARVVVHYFLIHFLSWIINIKFHFGIVIMYDFIFLFFLFFCKFYHLCKI